MPFNASESNMGTPGLRQEQYYLKEKVPETQSREYAQSMDAIEKSNGEILSTYPAQDMKAAVRAKLEASAKSTAQPKPATSSFFGSFGAVKIASTALAACLVVAFTAVTVTTVISRGGYLPGNAGTTLAMADTRTKGAGPTLFIYKKAGDKAIRLVTNSLVQADDIIQLSYFAGSASYGAILSVDGNGVVTQHYPDVGDLPGMLLPIGEVSMDFAYQLDDAPKFERFLFIVGNTVFSTSLYKAQLAQAARNAETPDFELPDSLNGKATVFDIILLK
jgi:hypothetical protein